MHARNWQQRDQKLKKKTVFVVGGYSRWKKDAQKRHAALLRLLTSCLGVFDVRRLTPIFLPFCGQPKIDQFEMVAGAA